MRMNRSLLQLASKLWPIGTAVLRRCVRSPSRDSSAVRRCANSTSTSRGVSLAASTSNRLPKLACKPCRCLRKNMDQHQRFFRLRECASGFWQRLASETETRERGPRCAHLPTQSVDSSAFSSGRRTVKVLGEEKQASARIVESDLSSLRCGDLVAVATGCAVVAIASVLRGRAQNGTAYATDASTSGGLDCTAGSCNVPHQDRLGSRE